MLRAASPRLFELIDPQAALERVATDLGFTEGPVWHRGLRGLLFSDIPRDVILRWDEVTLRDHWRPSAMANGLTLDRQLRLIACHHATSRVTRTELDGSVVVLASHWQDKELNSPNDVVVRSDGTVYFTDPPYGRRKPNGVPRPQQLDFQGVYRVDPHGGLQLAWGGPFQAPNGLCFSPDESVLYVNDSEEGHIRRFRVAPDGRLEGGEVFFTEDGAGPEGVPDGMKCDAQGNVWVCGPGGIWVITSKAELLGVIEVPENTTNLTWGGPDWRDLYITARHSVYRLATRIGPAPVPHVAS